MKKTNLAIALIASGLVMLFTGCVTANVNTVPGENILVNGDFEAGQDPWTPWIDSGWGGDGEVRWDDGIATLVIDEMGEEPWAVAMHYKKILIEKGEEYLFKFSAKSDEERVIRVGVSNGLSPSDPPYLAYTDVVLTTEWQDFEYRFRMLYKSDRFGRIDFNCAYNPGVYLPEGVVWDADRLIETGDATVYLDNVELRKFVPEVSE